MSLPAEDMDKTVWATFTDEYKQISRCYGKRLVYVVVCGGGGGGEIMFSTFIFDVNCMRNE